MATVCERAGASFSMDDFLFFDRLGAIFERLFWIFLVYLTTAEQEKMDVERI